ncbi:MAG: alanyl-tRNA editing protein, partial [Erysipelotrichaceae bacterium]|nr:alanyl-tRNA editing protein [Erysipelotrichaceae bacterium]
TMSELTKELYYDDAYLNEFQATVLSCEEDKKGYALTLDATAFYPEGGGQPYDTGTLNEAKVLEVHRRDDRIIHTVDTYLKPGTIVNGKVDFERRFDLMQQHSGEHVFSGLVHKHFGYDNIGFHLGEKEVVLDFSGPLDHKDLSMIEAECNRMIQKNIPVEVTYPNDEELSNLDYRSKKELSGRIRIVSIRDCDVCACCGTHVRKIGEVGYCKVLSLTTKKGNARVSVLFGKRATDYMARIYDEVTAISALISKNPLEILEGVRHLQDEVLQKGLKLNALYTKHFEERFEKETETSLFITIEEGCTMDLLRNFCDRMSAKAKTAAGLLKKSEEDYQYVIISKSEDLRAAAKSLSETFAGKGGGSKEMIQGSLHGSAEQIISFLHRLFD